MKSSSLTNGKAFSCSRETYCESYNVYGLSTPFIGAFRVMHPNTSHIVFTIKECVAGGGHFYSLNHLEQTLVARLREHYYGPSTFNSVQPGSQNMIIRLGRWLHRRLEEEVAFKGTSTFLSPCLRHLTNPLCRNAPHRSLRGSAVHAAKTAPIGAAFRKHSRRCPVGRRRIQALYVCQTFEGLGGALGTGDQVRVPAPISFPGDRGPAKSGASVGAQSRHQTTHAGL